MSIFWQKAEKKKWTYRILNENSKISSMSMDIEKKNLTLEKQSQKPPEAVHCYIYCSFRTKAVCIMK